MKRFGVLGVVAVMGLLLAACGGKTDLKGIAVKKPAIVFVAFGTSEPEAMKVFDSIDAAAKKRYPGYDIRWGYTAKFIINKLAKRGIVRKTPEQVLAELKAEGTTAVVTQSLHVVPGEKDAEVKALDSLGMKMAFGAPLLSSDADLDAALKAIEKDIKSGLPNVLAAHGNDKHLAYNKMNMAMEAKLKERYSNVFLCSVEGKPGIGGLTLAKAMAIKTGTVHFVPFMIVAGDHIMNDVMGDEADAWKKVIAAPKSTCAKPLGYNSAILDIYFAHLDTALNTLR